MEKERGIKITNVDKQKQCDIHVVSDTFFCVYHGSCIYKGVANICSNKEYCQSKIKAK